MSRVALALWLTVAPHPAGGAQPPREALRYQRDLVREARAAFGLDAPIAALAAQVHQESAWRADAVSPAGAVGLTQFMPATADWIGDLYAELRPADPRNPRWSLRAQARYMRWLLERTAARNDCESYAFALASYNGGLGWTKRRRAKAADPGRCLGAACDINPGVSASSQRENRAYPRRVLFRWQPVYRPWGGELCAAYGVGP